jgi:predicted N-acetyltransferase YhbS
LSYVARTATPADLDRIVAQLDQQFVFGKGRRISLAQRFPAVYCRENVGNMFLLDEQGEVLSCLVCKPFDLLHKGNRWRGTMIGAVYTRADRRGEGLATHVLEHSAKTLCERGLDFAVLWTDQSGFYTRLGWFSADIGVLGELESDARVPHLYGEVRRIPVQAGDFDCIERIRQRWCVCLTPRRIGDYLQLPLPAETVELLTWREGTEQAAYALVGSDGAMTVLYELIGYPGGFPALWSEMCRGSRRILVNDAIGSSSRHWLARNTCLVWRAKPLAMWLPLSSKIDKAQVKHWHVPYFDRI